MKKLSFLLIVLIAITTIFVSCDALIGSSDNDGTYLSNGGSSKSLDIELHVDDNKNSKALSVQSNTAVTKYTYTAICHTNPTANGVQTTEKEIQLVNGSATIKLVAGTWTITICGYNSDGGLVVKGECREKALSSGDKDVDINCVSANGTAKSSIKLKVGAPKTANGQIEMRWTKMSNPILPATANKIYTSATAVNNQDYQGAKEGYMKYEDTIANIDPETYMCQILYKVPGEAKAISGQMMVFKAVEKTPVNITGNFEQGEYIIPDFDIDIIPTNLGAHISENKSSTPNKSAKYEVTVDFTSVTNLTYAWYSNGETISGQTSSTLDWTPDSPGAYAISCILTGKYKDTFIYDFVTTVFEKTEE